MPRNKSPRKRHPLLSLDDEDLEFVLRMVLASGSLKELAKQFGVSYPTIRARLDRLISRLQTLVEGRERDPMAELLADLIERQELLPAAARKILKLHRDNLEKEKET